jgi:small-conductance mechanosensitive channel
MDEERRRRRLQIGGGVLALACIALVAAMGGYLRLARAIEFALIGAAQWALVLGALVRISDGFVAWALRVRPLRLLRAVQEHRTGLERSLQHVFHLLAGVFWAISVASILAILGPLTQRLTAILEAHVGYGAVRVSLGDFIAFLVVVWVTFQLSGAVRALLEEDLFARIRLGRGIALALSSLVHYAILLLGFMIGLGALGIDLTRITIIAGALGVGVGFGLQNVVNNFVSGLILLFERPIQVGDSVQLGTLTGEVKRIGIRSSTVRTFEGAEVIVPNASLVSDQVTNWTLSDRMRRIDLDIGIAYGTDPQRVVAVLTEVARTSPGVLPEPAPVVLFLGFGDSALNFQVRAWTARFEEWMKTRSDIGLAVQRALRAEGIDIPFPQRDVRIVREPDAPRALPERGENA